MVPAGTLAQMLRTPRATGAALALLLAACGSNSVPSATPCRARSTLPAPALTTAPLTASADRGQVEPGGTVTFVVRVTGPAHIHLDDCAAPLKLLVIDASQLHVYSGAAAALGDPAACPELILAAGQSLSVSTSWPVDSTLPGGVYAALLILGDAPQVTLAIAVGVAPHC